MTATIPEKIKRACQDFNPKAEFIWVFDEGADNLKLQENWYVNPKATCAWVF